MSDTVTLRLTDDEALMERIEDAEDRLALAATAPRRANLPLDQAERIWAGEHPLRVWRDHRRLTGPALSALCGVPQRYISDIERGKKPGSVGALDVPLESIIRDSEIEETTGAERRVL
jgi:hypothetical protein